MIDLHVRVCLTMVVNTFACSSDRFGVRSGPALFMALLRSRADGAFLDARRGSWDLRPGPREPRVRIVQGHHTTFDGTGRITIDKLDVHTRAPQLCEPLE